MSWPDPYFADKRVEEEARNIQAQHDDYAESQAFWAAVGWGLALIQLPVLIYLVVTR